MPSSTKNVKLGVCRLYYGGADLGLTKGGVEVTVSTDTHQVEVDQFGKTAVNDIILGRTTKVKAPLAETTLRNLVAIMPGANLITDGVQASSTITFAGQPTANDTITIGGIVFTFKAAAASNTDVKIGVDQPTTMANLAAVLNRYNFAAALASNLVAVVSSTTVVTVTAVDPGTAANAITLAKTSVNITVGGATLAGGVNETKARVEVTTGAGTDLLSLAKTLRLHPVTRADGDFTDDVTLYKAATPGALNFAYKLDSELLYEVEFTGYPDPVTGKIFEIGTPLA